MIQLSRILVVVNSISLKELATIIMVHLENVTCLIDISHNVKEVEDICAAVISNTVTSLSNVLLEIGYLLSPILDTGYKL